MSDFQNGDDLSLRSFEETDLQEVELLWTQIQTNWKDFTNLDHLSLQSCDPEDFLSDGEPEDQEKRPLDEPLDLSESSKSITAVPAARHLQVDTSGNEYLAALDHLINTASTTQQLDEIEKEFKDLDSYIDLDTTSVQTPSLPETLPSVANLIRLRLAPIDTTNLSLKAQVLLQGGSGELKQVTKTNKRGRGRKKAKGSVQEAWEEKKQKNMGQRFLQWLSRKLSCCSCIDVRF